MGVSLTERIAATNPHKPRTVTVKVSLDADLSEQREQLEAELAAAKNDTDRRQGQPDPSAPIQERIDALEQQENGTLIVLQFTKMSGLEWTDLATRYPARPGVKLDLSLGLNLPKVCTIAAQQTGVMLDDDGTTTPILPEEWPGFWEKLSGWDVNRIIDAIWELNVSIHAGRLARLGKA